MANKLTVSGKFKASADTTSTVGPITYTENAADKNLGRSQSGALQLVYDGNSACTYDGVVDTGAAWTTIKDAACYDGATLTIDGLHLTVNVCFCYIKVVSGIGASDELEVRVGSTVKLRTLKIGEAMVVPLNSAPIADSIFVRDTNYAAGSSELNVFMAMAGVDAAVDVTPPIPNPAEWYTAPYAVSHTEIQMYATVGTDASNPIEYKFRETSGNSGATDSNWQTSNYYADTGLQTATQYTYNVQMRDSLLNLGTVSVDAHATTQGAPDIAPPSPDPNVWSVVPTAAGTTSISMESTTAADAYPSNPVSYEFEETTGGGNSSGWQLSPIYIDTGLTAATQYTYRCRTKDNAGNIGGWSPSENVTTDAAAWSNTTAFRQNSGSPNYNNGRYWNIDGGDPYYHGNYGSSWGTIIGNGLFDHNLTSEPTPHGWTYNFWIKWPDCINNRHRFKGVWRDPLTNNYVTTNNILMSMEDSEVVGNGTSFEMHASTSYGNVHSGNSWDEFMYSKIRGSIPMGGFPNSTNPNWVMCTVIMRRDTPNNTSEMFLFFDGIEDPNTIKGGYPTGQVMTNIDTMAWDGSSVYTQFGTDYEYVGTMCYWHYLNGNPALLDNISTWNHGMTDAEVTELYNSGSPGDLSQHSKVANLSNWWDMNGTPGDTTTGFENRAPASSFKATGVAHCLQYISGTGMVMDYGDCDYDGSDLP